MSEIRVGDVLRVESEATRFHFSVRTLLRVICAPIGPEGIYACARLDNPRAMYELHASELAAGGAYRIVAEPTPAWGSSPMSNETAVELGCVLLDAIKRATFALATSRAEFACASIDDLQAQLAAFASQKRGAL